MSPIHQSLLSLPSGGVSLDSLTAQAHAGDSRSIERVAMQFESLFVSMVLKEMRQTLQPDTLFGNDTSDAYGGLFDLYMSQHVVEGGGFGVAKMVREYLERRHDAPRDAALDAPLTPNPSPLAARGEGQE